MTLEPSPSTFATILRRSKFASFDPSIAQIYTTHDGHAHRGNWGLKRPLALTKRIDSFRLFKSVDSREQQTEWHKAEQPARWIRVVSELGVTPQVDPFGLWNVSREGRDYQFYDSDYATPHSYVYPAVYHRNAGALPPRQFDRYVQSLRRKQPDFQKAREFVDKQKANQTTVNSTSTHPLPTPARSSSPIDQATRLSKQFLSQQAVKAFTQISSPVLQPTPHPNGGLNYLDTTSLTLFFLRHPLPGRMLRSHRNYTRTVLMGGMVGQMDFNDASGILAVPLHDVQGHKKPILLRVKSFNLENPPKVINTALGTGLGSTRTKLLVVEDGAGRQLRTLPYRLGSPEYITHEDKARKRIPGGRIVKFRTESEERRATSRTTDNIKLKDRLESLLIDESY